MGEDGGIDAVLFHQTAGLRRHGAWSRLGRARGNRRRGVGDWQCLRCGWGANARGMAVAADHPQHVSHRHLHAGLQEDSQPPRCRRLDFDHRLRRLQLDHRHARPQFGAISHEPPHEPHGVVVDIFPGNADFGCHRFIAIDSCVFMIVDRQRPANATAA